MIWYAFWLEYALYCWSCECTCLWLKEYVFFITMVFLKVHKVFNVNCIPLWNVSSLSMTQDMCAYDLMFSTTDVLNKFLPIPQHFRFSSLKVLWDDFKEVLEFLMIQVGYVLTFRVKCQYQAYEVVLLLRFICSLLFIWVLNIVQPICVFITLMYGLGPNYHALVRWLWYETRHPVETMLYLIYLRAIKVEECVIFLYEGSCILDISIMCI